MADRTLTTLATGGAFFEGPRWHDGRWWVSDFYRDAVYTVDTSGREELVMTVEGQPSGLGWLPDGSLLVVSMRDHRLLRRSPGGALDVVADVSEHCGGPLNDMVVDGAGRAWIGNFGFDLMGGGEPDTAALVRVDPDGTVAVAAEDLMFPNGSVVTPDGSTLIVGETAGCRYTAWTIGDDGTLSDRRVWAQLAPTPPIGLPLADVLALMTVAPDGCCLDAEGHIWSADEAGHRCIRIAEGGEIVDEVPAPDGLDVFACMLGGDDGRTLLMCVAPDFFESSRRAARDAQLLTTTVDVPHAGWP